MIVDDLDRRVQPEGVLSFVGLVEATDSFGQFLPFDLDSWEWHLHGVLLSQVTHVGVAVEDETLGPHTFLPELLGRRPLKRSKSFAYIFDGGRVQPRYPGTHVVPAQICA